MTNEPVARSMRIDSNIVVMRNLVKMRFRVEHPVAYRLVSLGSKAAELGRLQEGDVVSAVAAAMNGSGPKKSG